MKTKLFSITSFTAVAPNATVQMAHGLNVLDGQKVVPDEIKRRTEGLFVVTADETYLYVENKGAAAADIDVLSERWHSIERQLGKTDYEQSNLPIRPWETEGAAADDAQTPIGCVVWSPENPNGSFANVYDTWDGAYNACIAVAPSQGSVCMFIDARYSTDTLGDGSRVCEVPEGEWDMKGIILVNERLDDDSGARSQCGFAEDAFLDNCETVRARNLSFVQRSGVTTSPIRLGAVGEDTQLAVEGFGVIFRQEDATAAPLIKCNAGSDSIEIKCAGDASFASIGKPGFDSPDPIVDINGQTLKIGSGAMQLQNNCLIDSVGTGKVKLAAFDDAAMVGGIDGGDLAGNDYDFAAIPADTTKFVGNTFSRNRLMPTTAEDVDGDLVLDVKTADYQAKLGELVPCDTNFGGFTVTLPRAAPSPGEIVIVRDDGGKADKPGKSIRVAGAPNDRNPGGVPDTIQGQAGPVIIAVKNAALQFRSNGQGDWMIV